MAIAFTLFVAGLPAEARAQSQEKIEKANSISSWLIVGALAITLVVVIVTVSKGDKKDKDEGEQKDGEAQELRQYSEGQMRFETSSLNSQVFVSSAYEIDEVKGRPDNGSASFVENTFGQRRGCLMFAYEID